MGIEPLKPGPFGSRRTATEGELAQAKEVLAGVAKYLRSNLLGPKGEDLGNYPSDFGEFIAQKDFAERSLVVNDPTPWLLGEIQGLSKGAAKSVRKIMQHEIKSRGEMSRLLTDTGLEADSLSAAMRGTLFHGRSTLSEGAIKEGKFGTRITGIDEYNLASSRGIIEKGFEVRRPDLRGARGRPLNIGEPTGVSLSYSPAVGHKFSKRPDNELARVMPLYGGPPEDVIINAWTPKGGKIMKEAYMDAAKELSGNIASGTNKQLKDQLAKIESNQNFKDFLLTRDLKTTFNKMLTKSLQKKGHKGILYSTGRYSEYELKMFDPKDVLVIDRRKMFTKGPQLTKTFKRMGFKPKDTRITGETQTMRQMDDLTLESDFSSLREWYAQLDVAKELGLRKSPTPPEGLASAKLHIEAKKYKAMLDKAEDLVTDVEAEKAFKEALQMDMSELGEMINNFNK